MILNHADGSTSWVKSAVSARQYLAEGWVRVAERRSRDGVGAVEQYRSRDGWKAIAYHSPSGSSYNVWDENGQYLGAVPSLHNL